MFGHNDDDNKTDQPADDPNAMPNVVPDPSVTASLVNPTAPVVNTGSDAPSSVPSAPSVPPVPDASEEMTNDTSPLGDSADTSAPADTPDDSAQTSSTISDDSIPSDGSDNDVVTKGDASDEEPAQSEETSEPEATQPADDELISLKQQALEQLSPLVDHLDQTPEEKFRTTMMMIQASDNSSLVKVAYEAAQAITDDKVRAQALLDVINEINYFTQNKTNEKDS